VSSALDHPETLANIQLRAVPPDRPTYRGTHRPTFAASFAPAPLHRGEGYQRLETDVGVTDVGRTETSQERTPSAEEVNKWRFGKGYPGWVDVRSMPEFWEDRAAKTKGKAPRHTGAISLRDVEEGDTTQAPHPPVRFADTPTLKAWCEAYCRDQGRLKSFMMRKWIWGWEMAALESGESVSVRRPAQDLADRQPSKPPSSPLDTRATSSKSSGSLTTMRSRSARQTCFHAWSGT
jgi:hypothetical protein